MKRNTFYPIRIADQIIWIGTFRNKLASHATALGLAPAQVTAILADCDWLLYVLQKWLPAVRNWAQSGTDFAAEAQSGFSAGAQELPVFVPPALPEGVVAVAAGALDRIFTLIQVIKDGGKCSDTIATDLGIVGSEQIAPDYTTLQPVISVSLVGGQVFIKWGWSGYTAFLDMCEIQVDRGDGKGFVLLAYDTTPGYTDTQAFPAALTKWTYRAIYHQGETTVGILSQPASIIVPG